MFPGEKYSEDFDAALAIMQRCHPDGQVNFFAQFQTATQPGAALNAITGVRVPRWIVEFQQYLKSKYPDERVRMEISKQFIELLLSMEKRAQP